MTKTLRIPMSSTTSYIVLGLIVSLAVVMFAVPYAHAAESPNILVGENMTVGSTGPGVVVLQGLLSEWGYLTIPTGIPMGYYGALTQAALARYQGANDISPAVGYFGPITKVAMHTQLMGSGRLPSLGW